MFTIRHLCKFAKQLASGNKVVHYYKEYNYNGHLGGLFLISLMIHLLETKASNQSKSYLSKDLKAKQTFFKRITIELTTDF